MSDRQWGLSAGVAVLLLFCGGTISALADSADSPTQKVRLTSSFSGIRNTSFVRSSLYLQDGSEEPGDPFRDELEAPPLPDDVLDDTPKDDLPEVNAPKDDVSTDDTDDPYDPMDGDVNDGAPGELDLDQLPLPRSAADVDEVEVTDQDRTGDLGYVIAEGGPAGYADSYDPGFYGYPAAGCPIVFGGWLEQGITTNGTFPVNRFNGPVGFNDRDGEYQMNGLWLYCEKETNTCGYGFDIGGRVNLMYGTDARYNYSRGLEVTRNWQDKWNSERFYGIAAPQAYVDVAINDLLVRMGHYYTIVGYETNMAPDNFFYSHSYALFYGEPYSHTGVLASLKVNRHVSISGGFDRGWNNWEDNNHDVSFLGGITCTNCDETSSLALALASGNYDDTGELSRTMYSLVFSHKLTERLEYVAQYDWGLAEEEGVQMRGGQRYDGEWYGVVQNLLYEMNPCWDLGFRVEWFRDTHGTRVGGMGAPHGWDLGPDSAANQIGWAGTFWEMTLGLNWKPHPNITVRPECRWDWYDGPTSDSGDLPFNSGRNADQFTAATDLIITF